jgi:hypothetical protein
LSRGGSLDGARAGGALAFILTCLHYRMTAKFITQGSQNTETEGVLLARDKALK